MNVVDMRPKACFCVRCGELISTESKACPYCGAKQKKFKARNLLWIVLALTVVGGIWNFDSVVSTIQTTIQTLEISRGDYTAQCSPVIYKDVARNPDQFKGSSVTFSGVVLQVEEDSPAVYLILQDNAESLLSLDAWYVTYNQSRGEPRILAGDRITVYGDCTGIQSYESVLGTSQTVPSMQMRFYDLKEDR